VLLRLLIHGVLTHTTSQLGLLLLEGGLREGIGELNIDGQESFLVSLLQGGRLLRVDSGQLLCLLIQLGSKLSQLGTQLLLQLIVPLFIQGIHFSSVFLRGLGNRVLVLRNELGLLLVKGSIQSTHFFQLLGLDGNQLVDELPLDLLVALVGFLRGQHESRLNGIQLRAGLCLHRSLGFIHGTLKFRGVFGCLLLQCCLVFFSQCGNLGR
jgi:hypothetical protein